MSTLSSEEIDHLAELTRLSLNAEEAESFSEQLPRIVDFVGQLSKGSSDKVGSEDGYVTLESLRDDEISSERLTLEEIEKLAPEFSEGRVVVPPVLGENSDV